MTTAEHYGEVTSLLDALEPEPLQRLNRDLIEAARTLSDAEARYLCDAYYVLQEYRKGSKSQERALTEHTEPCLLINWLGTQHEGLEGQIRRALDAWTEGRPLGVWLKSLTGIGPVLAAGLIAHTHIEHCPTAGHLWSFAGLNPDQRWEKGQKRPWNAMLKTICVHPSCTVNTRRGNLPISEVRVGDEVLTHLGRWRRVTQVYVNPFEGDLVGVRSVCSGNQVAWLTPGHPVFCAPAETWKSGRTFKVNPKTQQGWGWGNCAAIKPRWLLKRPAIAGASVTPDPMELNGIDIGEGRVAAQGRWDGVPHPRAVPVQQTIPVDAALMRFFGLYIAEGHVSKTTITFSFHAEEKGLIEFVQSMFARLTGFGGRVNPVHNNSVQISLGCKPLAEVMALRFGLNGDSMSIPVELIEAPDELAEALWDGIMAGDGDHVGELAGRRISIGGANGQLARQIVDLGRRLGKSVSLHSEKNGRSYRIMVNDKPDIEVRARESLSRPYSGPVYNLEVAEDHSYCVEGYAVHNCWKAGECFVKFSNHEQDIYGKWYRARKEYEERKNRAGDYAPQAASILASKKIGKDTDAYAWYAGCLPTTVFDGWETLPAAARQARVKSQAGEPGSGVAMLPPAHIHARSKRYAVKLFLSHHHECAYFLHYGVCPPKPYPIAILGHAHEIEPPHRDLIPGWDEARAAIRAASPPVYRTPDGD